MMINHTLSVSLPLDHHLGTTVSGFISFVLNKEMFWRNVMEDVRGRWERKYRESKMLIKRLVRESKKGVDEDFCWKISAKF